MVAVFEKRPQRVHAVQYLAPESRAAVMAFLGERLETPIDDNRGLLIRTWRGWERVGWGNWIVRDEAGQVHRYEDADFRDTYRAINEGRP
jgi:hypothetical protein